jgi:hypothetical protein
MTATRKTNQETQMNNHENHTGKSESFNVFTMAAAAVAIGGTALALMLMPAQATSEASVESTESYSDAGYLPAQLVSQARYIEVLPEQF